MILVDVMFQLHVTLKLQGSEATVIDGAKPGLFIIHTQKLTICST